MHTPHFTVRLQPEYMLEGGDRGRFKEFLANRVGSDVGNENVFSGPVVEPSELFLFRDELHPAELSVTAEDVYYIGWQIGQ